MPATALGQIILVLVVLGDGVGAYTALKSNSKATMPFDSQEEKVESIADTMRDSQNLPGSASDTQIDNWETQMKKLVDPGNQKTALCRLYAIQATTFAAVERATRQSGNQEMIADVQDDINALPLGSLEEWLFQLARVGSRPAEYVNHECMQQPTVQVLNPGVRRNSQQMRDLEAQCLSAGTC